MTEPTALDAEIDDLIRSAERARARKARLEEELRPRHAEICAATTHQDIATADDFVSGWEKQRQLKEKIAPLEAEYTAAAVAIHRLAKKITSLKRANAEEARAAVLSRKRAQTEARGF